MSEPLVCPKTRFGHPIRTQFGDDSAMWRGDRLTLIRSIGTHALVLIEWGQNIHNEPHAMTAWLQKRQLRFSKP